MFAHSKLKKICYQKKRERTKKKPEYRDKDFHELVGMNVKDTISTTTVNKHLGYCSSFFDWSINHGYSDINPFKGMKLKRTVTPRD